MSSIDTDKKIYFSKYKAIEKIGEGSFGKIYLVEDKLLNIFQIL